MTDPIPRRSSIMTNNSYGQYTRTTPDPVDMDGGATAALIEGDR